MWRHRHKRNNTVWNVCLFYEFKINVLLPFLYFSLHRQKLLRNYYTLGIAQSVQKLATDCTVRGWNPAETRFSAPVQTDPGANSAPTQWVPRHFIGGKAARAWSGLDHRPTPKGEVKERVSNISSPPLGLHGQFRGASYLYLYRCADRLCGLVVRVSGYRYTGLGFDSRRYQIF